MQFPLVTLFALMVATGVARAEGPGQPDKSKPAAAQQQRRAALRAELKAQRAAGPQKEDRPERQLSPNERQKLREQLRQQRKDALQQRQTTG
jgi:hypothetical protein